MDRKRSTTEKQAQKGRHQGFEKAIEAIINGGTLPTSEGEEAETEGVGTPATPVTTSTNPTNPRVLGNKPVTHLKQIRQAPRRQ